MIGLDLVKYSWESLKKRKLRSWLTIISVLIGIMAIFSLVSFGQGLSSYVTDMSEKMGSDKIIIQARGSTFGAASLDSNVILGERDLNFIRKVNGVEEATGMYVESVEVEFDDKKKYVFAIGSDYKDYEELIDEIYTLKVDEGKPFRGKEKNKVLLGYNYRVKDKIFSKPLKVGDKLTVNGNEVKVQGFYEEVGNPQDDSNVYFNKEAAEDLFDSNNYMMITLRSFPGEDPVKVAETVKEKLRKYRNQKEGNEDFSVQTYQQLLETFTTILGVINAVLIIIALISIVVAGINIMNTMYTSVLERTQEIGVMKSIGAKNSHILLVFVFESGLLGLIGGVLGVVLGYFISSYAGKIIAGFGYSMFSPIFTPGLIIGCLFFAFFIGAVSGLLPAKRASKLNPVDSLRYE